ncbi:hypothetical protein ALO39_200012 [Pseudomonas syringae pv. lapsa]|nr:hypothetical protein ALO39_200012 [Pseudomonas syringae pv. lapsa]
MKCFGTIQLFETLRCHANLRRDDLKEVFQLAAAGVEEVAQLVVGILEDVREFVLLNANGFRARSVLLEFSCSETGQRCKVRDFLSAAGGVGNQPCQSCRDASDGNPHAFGQAFKGFGDFRVTLLGLLTSPVQWPGERSNPGHQIQCKRAQ